MALSPSADRRTSRAVTGFAEYSGADTLGSDGGSGIAETNGFAEASEVQVLGIGARKTEGVGRQPAGFGVDSNFTYDSVPPEIVQSTQFCIIFYESFF